MGQKREGQSPTESWGQPSLHVPMATGASDGRLQALWVPEVTQGQRQGLSSRLRRRTVLRPEPWGLLAVGEDPAPSPAWPLQGDLVLFTEFPNLGVILNWGSWMTSASVKL